jgi:hypothetical protein
MIMAFLFRYIGLYYIPFGDYFQRHVVVKQDGVRITMYCVERSMSTRLRDRFLL